MLAGAGACHGIAVGDERTGRQVEESVYQRQENAVQVFYAFASVPPQESLHARVGSVPAVIKGDGGSDQGYQAHGHFDVVVHTAMADGFLLKKQVTLAARRCTIVENQPPHLQVGLKLGQGFLVQWTETDETGELLQHGSADVTEVRAGLAFQRATGEVTAHFLGNGQAFQGPARLLSAAVLANDLAVGRIGKQQ
ncbi:hypothetical protein D3C77_339830 [compost metagenome]